MLLEGTRVRAWTVAATVSRKVYFKMPLHTYMREGGEHYYNL